MATVTRKNSDTIIFRNPSDDTRFLRIQMEDGRFLCEACGKVWLTPKNARALIAWLQARIDEEAAEAGEGE